jgi:hypothetical protein
MNAFDAEPVQQEPGTQEAVTEIALDMEEMETLEIVAGAAQQGVLEGSQEGALECPQLIPQEEGDSNNESESDNEEEPERDRGEEPPVAQV